MALLVGELYAKITSDSSQYRRDMDEVDRKGASSAKKAEANALKVEHARKAEADAAGKVRVAETQLAELREKSNVKASRLAAAEERLAAAHRNVAKAQAQTAALLRNDGESLGDAIGDGVVKGLKAKASDDKLRNALKAVNMAGWLAQGGVLGAGLGAGVAAGMVGVLATAAPIGLAAVLLKDSEKLQTAYNGVFDQVLGDAKGFAGVLEGPLLHASEDLSASWTRMAPTVAKLFDDAIPSVEHLTHGVTGLAEGIVGGLGTAVSRSEPIMAGLDKMLVHTGRGMGDFFDNSTKHSIASGQIMEHFGVLTEKALGTAGTAIDKLATAYAPHTHEVEQFASSAGNAIGKLADGALPMLADSAGTTLKIFSAGLNVIAPFADELGTVLGVVLPLYSGFRLLNTVISPFEKLLGKGGLAGALGEGGIAAAMSKTTKDSSGLAAKLGALAGTAGFGAVGGAVAVTGALLGTYYLEQRKVSEFGSKFAQGMLAGGDAARGAAESYASVSKEMADLTRQRDAWNAQPDVIAMGADDAKGSAMNDRIMERNQLLEKAKKDYDDLHASLGPLGQRQLELNKALAESGPSSDEASRASAAYAAEKEKATAAELAFQAAVETSNARMINQQNTLLGTASASLNYQSSVMNAEDALKTHNETVAKYGAGSREAANSLLTLQAAELARVGSAREQALATSTATNEESKQVAVTAAGTAEILKMAAATNGNWTPAMQTAIGTMSATELATIGVTRSVNEAGQAVYRLPDGRIITVTADTQAAKDQLAELEKWKIHDKFFTVVMHQQVDKLGVPIAGSNRTGADGSQMGGGGLNSGGWVPGSGPDRDSVPTVLTPKEFVVNRRAAAKYGPFLEAMNKAAGGTVDLPTPQAMPVPQAARTMLAATAPQTAAGPGTVVNNYHEYHFHEIKSMPSQQWVRDTLADIENGVRC